MARLLDAEDGGPGGLDCGGVLTGGLAELLGGLGDVEDVIDDLEGESGFFPEGAEAGDGVDVSVCRSLDEAEETAADDRSGDERAGLGTVNAVDEFGSGLVAFAFDVHDLTADHSGRNGAADAGSDGERELA